MGLMRLVVLVGLLGLVVGCRSLHFVLAWSLPLGVEVPQVFLHKRLENLFSQWQDPTLNQNGDFQMEWGIALGVEVL